MTYILYHIIWSVSVSESIPSRFTLIQLGVAWTNSEDPPDGPEAAVANSSPARWWYFIVSLVGEHEHSFKTHDLWLIWFIMVYKWFINGLYGFYNWVLVYKPYKYIQWYKPTKPWFYDIYIYIIYHYMVYKPTNITGGGHHMAPPFGDPQGSSRNKSETTQLDRFWTSACNVGPNVMLVGL